MSSVLNDAKNASAAASSRQHPDRDIDCVILFCAHSLVKIPAVY